jgi:peptide/nickel transport system ATP-binding protein
MAKTFKESDVLLDIKGLKIQGYSDEKWVDIIKGVDLKLHRGEVMGLIGESGAGKSTIGAAAIALLTVAVNFVVDWMLYRSSGLKV